ncbi:hypothetical protein SAMN05421823_101587 [Catalinimonas alkaloidigena]|uniref:Cytochrome C and Quinol oxidase polypeptide I n=1 Tax=Catalinimonas alkaloidigena TaxID=1075417 RepID=A0A1G8Y840_9BACT|nr:hypothetical protein [Catalinimonas alkaloidigena]SDJ98604.1 hypothetical protein SAMN05421823_101587 [Catalinimonas alkaloidigena]
MSSKKMELHLNIIGVLLVALATLHLIFPRYFDWKKDLHSLQLINRQMMYVHTFFVAFVVLLMGLLCMTSAHELVHTPLGRRIALGLGTFWSARLLIQFFGYSSKLWRGKPLETGIHLVFIGLWSYLSIVFYIVYSQQHR